MSYRIMNAFCFPFSHNLEETLKRPLLSAAKTKKEQITITDKCVVHLWYCSQEAVKRFVQYVCNLGGICLAHTTSPAVKQPLRG